MDIEQEVMYDFMSFESRHALLEAATDYQFETDSSWERVNQKGLVTRTHDRKSVEKLLMCPI